jgi:hypothetical protein
VKPSVVAITGLARHGKDSLWQLVLGPVGYSRLALADPLKSFLLARSGDVSSVDVGGLFDWVRLHYEFFGESKSARVREALQSFGTEVIRSTLDPGFWVAAALGEVRSRVLAGGRVAVTDVRFPNEAAALMGDVDAVRAFYREHEAAGGVVNASIMDQLTRRWSDVRGGVPGLLPDVGVGCSLVKVVRPGFGEVMNHASELSVGLIDAPVVVSAVDLVGLRAAGEAWFGSLGGVG